MMLKGAYIDSRLRINVCSKNVYFEVYVDHTGDTFKIEKSELKKLLGCKE